MPQTPQEAFSGLFQALNTIVAAQQVLNDLPLVGDKLAGALPDFSALSSQISAALAQLTPEAGAARIASVLDGIVPGLTARTSGTDVDVSFNIFNTITSPTFTAGLDLGVPGLNLDINGTFGVSFSQTLALNVRLDTLGGGLTLLDNGTPELNIGLAVDASLNGDGQLGPLALQARDKQPGHEIELNLGMDLRSLNPVDVVVTTSGRVDLNEGLKVSLGSPDLPFIATDLELKLAFGDDGPGDAHISFNHLAIGLGGLIAQLAAAMKPVLDIIDSDPFRQIYDALIAPLPLIDSGLADIGATGFFDKVPGLQKDGRISLLDLYALRLGEGSEEYKQLVLFTDAMALIRQLAAFTRSGRDMADAQIDLGSYSFIGGAPQIDIADLDVTQGATAVVKKALALIKGAPALQGLTNIAEHLTIGDKSLNTLLSQDKSGFEMPLLDTPTDALRLLLPKLFGTKTVTFVAFDIPEQRFTKEVMLPFGFAPLQGEITGSVDAYLDFKVGYDSRGIYTPQGDLRLDPLEGIFIDSTRDDHIIAYLDFALRAGVGLGLGTTIGTYFEGGIEGNATFTLPQPLRISDIENGYLFTARGKIDAVLDALVRVDFGFARYVQRFDLVRETLVDFDSSGGAGRHTAPGRGLATVIQDGGQATLRLNVGTYAGERETQDNQNAVIGDQQGDVAEVFHLSNAVNAAGQRIVGAITVTAFGLKETYGSAAAPLLTVRAFDMREQKDALVADADFAMSILAHGGNEADHLQGGQASDTLYGDDGDDILLGGAGGDSLYGGNGDDLLIGGEGADLLDGEADHDIVSYAKSKAGVSFSFVNGELRGSGGDAEGDTLRGVDDFEGSPFNDTLRGNPGDPSVLKGNDGNDKLVGGAVDDFLLGGAGADTLYGGGGNNSTSYVQSRGGVLISLLTGTAAGADAQGDRFQDIQNVQGSGFDDLLHGDRTANRLDGWNGDDVLEGFGGADTLTGGFGDDTVFGGANGLLDGGPGTDLLSYAHITSGAITVNLRNGSTSRGDSIVRMGDVSSFENLTGTPQSGDDLTGDIRDNVIIGLAGMDTLRGDDGNDTLIGGAQANLLDGGPGLDLADYIGSGSGVTVRLANPNAGFGTGERGDAQGDRLSDIENLRGTLYGDTLVGNDADNEIDPVLTSYNSGGADSVDGMGGTDILVLDYTRRDYVGGVTGGFGLNQSSSGSFVRMGATAGTIADEVRFSSIEQLRVTGTRLGDTLYGGAAGDLLIGGGGDDLIYSGLGPDQVFAGDGNDRVVSGTDIYRGFSSFGGGTGFLLDGGGGIDTLSISLAALTSNVSLTGTSGIAATSLINLSLPGDGGIGILNFEILGNVTTGRGDDIVAQPGRFDNVFNTGNGMDRLSPGLGIDVVNGGADYVAGREIGVRAALVIDEAAFAANGGDLLTLDYAAVNGAVTAALSWHLPGLLVLDEPYGRITNAGTVTTVGGEALLSFDEIERMAVTGSRFGDLLVGTYRSANRDDPSQRGRDVLQGGAGNDTLIGNSGSDTLFGGDGNDSLIGTRQDGYYSNEAGYDHWEVDELWGGAGADRFILGSAGLDANGKPIGGYYYTTFISDLGEGNWAQIQDFTPSDGDRLVLAGRASDYFTSLVGSTTYLYHVPTGGPYAQLVAKLSNTLSLNLSGTAVEYLSPGGNAAMQLAGPPAMNEIITVEPPALGGAGPLGIPAPSVTTTADPAVLQASLFSDGSNGLITESLELTGDARGFGTFGHDLLGMGSGIVLSTGKVSDLIGPNLVDGGASRPPTISLNFVKIGRTGNTDLYYADLSNLGIDLRSLTIRDGNSKEGGLPGTASGFDLDAVLLSRNLLTPADFAQRVGVPGDINTAIGSPLDVFDFSNASTRFSPGSQHAPTATDQSFNFGRDLNSTKNGLVDFDVSTLGQFDFGYLTLGDAGSISFNLTSAVSTSGPLYLYVGEGGVAGENLAGSVLNASSSRYDDAAGDLSTDFGAPGVAGDATSLTYTFHKAPGSDVNTVAFQFALFSEELREFAGSGFNDSFRITLNGVNLARLSDGAALTVNNLLAVPLTRGSADLIINPLAGQPGSIDIRADSYTQALTFEGELLDGTNTLTIEVKDARDGLLDSGILVKAGSLGAYYKPRPFFGLPQDTVLPPRHMIDAEGPRLAEGQAGGTAFDFTVHRVNDVSLASDVEWRVLPRDYPGNLYVNGADFVGGILPSGQVHFDAGQTSATITVQVAGDRNWEFEGNFEDEHFQVEIFNPSVGVVGNALLGSGTIATATILNDDVQYDLIQPGRTSYYASGDDYELLTQNRLIAFSEGSAGATEISFVVTRRGDLSSGSSVGWAVWADGYNGNLDATDFMGGVAPEGRVFFAPGETAKTITFSLAGDTTPEPDEILGLYLIDRQDNSYPYVLDGSNHLLATIVDDDRGPAGIELVSINARNEPIGGLQTISSFPNQANRPTISADGRYVVFDSNRVELAPYDYASSIMAVFRKDMLTGALDLVSAARNPSNVPVLPDAQYSHSEAISNNGRYVAFISGATNLEDSEKDANFAGGIFVRDMQTGAITLAYAAEDPSGNFNPSQAYYYPVARPMVSDNGRIVVFGSEASASQTDSFTVNGLYATDLRTGLTTRVDSIVYSQGLTIEGDAPVIAASMSADGTRVAFTSYASNLGANVSVPGAHLFIKDLPSGALTFISNVPPGMETDLAGAQFGQGLSADGRYVVTAETERADPNATGIGLTFYRRDLVTGTVTVIDQLATTDADTLLPYAPSISSDGRFVLYLGRTTGTDSQVFVRDLTTGASAQVVGTTYQETPLPEARSATLSADGEYITFNAYPQGPAQVFRIPNPLAPARYSFAGHSVALEGEALQFTVIRTRSDTAETVTYTLQNNNNQAQSGTDFVGTGGQVSFAPGELVKTFTVQTLLDGDDREDVEYIFPTLISTDGAGRIIGPGPEGGDNFAQAWGLIVNADLAIGLTADSLNVSRAEGDAGGTTFHYILTRDGATASAQSVVWSVAGAGINPADAADFVGGAWPSGMVTFATGASEASIDILVAGDTAREPDEAFTLRIGSGIQAGGIILNDDILPRHGIVQSELSIAEGSAGVTLLHLTIAREHDLSQASSVDWTVDGIGTSPVSAGGFLGGILPSGTAFFLPGQSTADVLIRVVADTVVEADETYTLTLSNPSIGSLGNASALVTIRNDDTAIGFAAGSGAVSLDEGQQGVTLFTFAVDRTGDLSVAGSVGWAVSDSGVYPADHVDFDGGAMPSGTLDFAPGEARQFITLGIVGEAALEADETFTLTLSNGATALGTILNDDLPTLHSLVLRQAEMTEGGAPLILTVLRTNDITVASTVEWSVTGTGANPAGGADFLPAGLPRGSLDFHPGETRKDIVLAARDDGLMEPDESFVLRLSQSSDASSTTVTIHSNDPARTLRLTQTADYLPGGPAPDLYLAEHDTFSAGDLLDGLGGGNRVELQGGGLFDLRLPERLANLDKVIAIERQAGSTPGAGQQTLMLRDGLAIRVDVVAGTIDPSNPNTPGIVIEGSKAANVIQLGQGDARVVLGDAAETVLGGGGRNIFVVNAATIGATIDGGTGTSVLEVQGGGIVRMGANVTRVETVTLLDAASGYDFAAVAAVRLTGSAGYDTVRGGAGLDTVDGGGGDDIIDGGAGDDALAGGAGTDTASFASASGAVFYSLTAQGFAFDTQGAGVDMLVGFENVLGGAFDDTLAGDAGANALSGGIGDDVLYGAALDTLIGGAGNDTYVVFDATSVVSEDAGQGIDIVYVGVDGFTVGPNIEVVRLFGDVTQVAGSAGSEQIVASGTADTTIHGGDGDDTLWGNGRANTLYGDAGDDILRGGGGPETMIGGLGNDQFVIRSLGTIVVENADGGFDTAWLAVDGFTLSANIEIGRLAAPGAVLLNGSDSAEDLVANLGAASTLNGNGGNDVLWGSAFADTLNGGDGDDIVRGQGGADVMAGGKGNDQYVVFNAMATITEEANGGYDIVYVVASTGVFVLGENVEEARLAGAATALVGGQGAELLVGNNAGLASSLYGNGGNDILYGTPAADTLSGGAGDDTIYCQGGADMVEFGGPGNWGADSLGGFSAGAKLHFLAGSGISEFGQLVVTVDNGNTYLSCANGSVLVFGAIITASDCVFG